MTTLTMQTLLAALMLWSGADRPAAAEPVRGAVAAAAPVQPAAKDRTGRPPSDAPAQQAGLPAPGSDMGVARPSAADLDTIHPPFAGPVLPPNAVQGAPRGRALSMPANPFSAIAPGATAQRQAAVYGMFVGPAPAVGNAKAFAGYQPTSPISPYMGLYAPRTLGVDNYNAYVRPQLQQQAFNQQVDTTFRALEPDRGQPGPTARSFEEMYSTGPGTSSATFMNLRPYYPNYPGSK